MQLRYDDDFVEGAVFARANSRSAPLPALQVRRLHAGRERLYSILDPDERNTAFFECHLEWFREWGLEKTLLDAVDEFARLRGALSVLVFRKARVKNDEGAELYVSAENGRAAVVALRVERFAPGEDLSRFLRHELAHLDDMVNPAFGYSPELPLPGANPAQQRLTRERYRLLWGITIDGRLAASGRAIAGTREQHRAAFDRGFNFWPEAKRDECFNALWRNDRPHHADLIAIASDPRDLKSAFKPTPGAPCPLCGFATFDWADTGNLDGRTTQAIQREFAHWTADDGACGRCIEIYRRSGARLPSTAPGPCGAPAALNS